MCAYRVIGLYGSAGDGGKRYLKDMPRLAAILITIPLVFVCSPLLSKALFN